MKLLNSVRNPSPNAIRVEQRTAPEVNERISCETEVSLGRAAANPERIERRLAELDREWDIERVLQTNFGVINLVTLTVGALAASPFFLLTGITAVFMAKHALEGWCPPVPIFRRFGVRTAREIAHERYALKALRGDFEGARGEPEKAFQAASLG